MKKITFISLCICLSACGKTETQNTSPPLNPSPQLTAMGRCNGTFIKQCNGATVVGCSFDNIYADLNSTELWTSFDGTQTFQGYCAYGSFQNSCPAGTVCP